MVAADGAPQGHRRVDWCRCVGEVVVGRQDEGEESIGRPSAWHPRAHSPLKEPYRSCVVLVLRGLCEVLNGGTSMVLLKCWQRMQHRKRTGEYGGSHGHFFARGRGTAGNDLQHCRKFKSSLHSTVENRLPYRCSHSHGLFGNVVWITEDADVLRQNAKTLTIEFFRKLVRGRFDLRNNIWIVPAREYFDIDKELELPKQGWLFEFKCLRIW